MVSFKDCDIIINNQTYTSKTTNIEGEPLQIPLDGISILEHRMILNLSLEHLHKLQTETRSDLEHLKLTSNSIHWGHWSFFTAATFSPIIIGIIILLIIFPNRNKIEFRYKFWKPNTTDREQQVEDNRRSKFRRPTLTDVIPMEVHH